VVTKSERSDLNGEAERIGFFLAPEFSMIALFSAVEPLRVANRLSGRQLYDWRLFSVHGGPVIASNGMSLVVDASISGVERFPAVVVCASFGVERPGCGASIARAASWAPSKPGPTFSPGPAF
jgi:AraC family carnitine catabolism transcriptional activator